MVSPESKWTSKSRNEAWHFSDDFGSGHCSGCTLECPRTCALKVQRYVEAKCQRRPIVVRGDIHSERPESSPEPPASVIDIRSAEGRCRLLQPQWRALHARRDGLEA